MRLTTSAQAEAHVTHEARDLFTTHQRSGARQNRLEIKQFAYLHNLISTVFNRPNNSDRFRATLGFQQPQQIMGISSAYSPTDSCAFTQAQANPKPNSSIVRKTPLIRLLCTSQQLLLKQHLRLARMSILIHAEACGTWNADALEVPHDLVISQSRA